MVDTVAGVQSRRDVDGIVVLGEPHRIASPNERTAVSLDGRDVIVIQTKATRLNPYVFGQALLSMDLIRMRWAPRSLRSVLLCAADDPELRAVISAFPDVEVRVIRTERFTSFRLGRIPGAAAQLASQRALPLLEKPRLTSSFQIDGMIIPSWDTRHQAPLAELVADKEVITVHSEAKAGQPSTLGMWMSGEVIIAQHLLRQMGTAATHSIVLCGRGDQNIEAALRRYASFEIVEVDPATQPRPVARRTSASQLRPTERAWASATGAMNVGAEPVGQQRESGTAQAGADQEFIPGHYCRLCGWPFTASQRRTQCQVPRACQRRQELPLHLRGYGCPYNDRVHPEWRDLHS